MNKFVLKPNQGSLFKNDRKASDNHPDLTGSINVNGTEYWLSAWNQTGKGPVIKLTVKPKDAARRPSGESTPAPASEPQEPEEPRKSSVPF